MGERNSVVETAVKRTSWGKSRNELLCRFHNSGGLHRISGDALLETRILTHEGNHDDSRLIDNSTCDVDVNANHIPEPRDAMHGNGIPGVVEGRRLDACRRDCSRGSPKPLNAMHGIVVTGVANRCNCHTIRSTLGVNINGANTDIADPPPYCHTFKANTPSSQRSREAAIAYLKEACKLVKRNTKHNRDKNANKKKFKQKIFLKDVKPPSNLASNTNINFLTIEEMTKRIVVCDVGKTDNDGIQPLEKDIYCLKICNGDLWVADTLNASLGLHHIPTSDIFSTFILLPRNESLQILSNS